MTVNTLCQVATACLMILVSSVICGRVPVGISRVNFVEEDVKPFKSSEEYVDLDNLHNSDDTAVYITDVQISELQNAREKVIKLSSKCLNSFQINYFPFHTSSSLICLLAFIQTYLIFSICTAYSHSHFEHFNSPVRQKMNVL